MNQLNYPILKRVQQVPTILNKIRKIINWVPINTLLSHRLVNRINAVGNQSYPPLKMFKILILQVLFNLSDREMDESLFDRVSFRKFTGFLYELHHILLFVGLEINLFA